MVAISLIEQLIAVVIMAIALTQLIVVNVVAISLIAQLVAVIIMAIALTQLIVVMVVAISLIVHLIAVVIMAIAVTAYSRQRGGYITHHTSCRLKSSL